MPNTRYKSQTFLNVMNSPHTSSVVCYDGDYQTDEGKLEPWQFIEISDCHNKIRLHNYRGDKEQDKAFVDKLKRLRREIDEFITHLER